MPIREHRPVLIKVSLHENRFISLRDNRRRLFALYADKFVCKKLEVIPLVWNTCHVRTFARFEKLGEDVYLVLLLVGFAYI